MTMRSDIDAKWMTNRYWIPMFDDEYERRGGQQK